MSETETDDVDGGPEGVPSGEGGVKRVLDALAPFVEQANHFRGFSVKYADARSASQTLDRSTVEVRIKYPEREPRDADMVMGILQGNGFDPEKRRRGGESTMVFVVSVDVGEPSEDGPEWDTPTDPGEQVTFD